MPRRGHFTPWERSGTHCREGWVSLRDGLDGCQKSSEELTFCKVNFLSSNDESYFWDMEVILMPCYCIVKVWICLKHFCVVYNNLWEYHSVPWKVKLIKSCFTGSPFNACCYSNNCTLVLSVTKCPSLLCDMTEWK